MNRPELPTRPYKDFADYLSRKRKEAFSYNRQFPCLRCGGIGKIRRDEDYDPYEGYKLAPWYSCDMCGGTGEVPEVYLKYEYDEIIKRWRVSFNKVSKTRDIYDSAVAKLTEEEKSVLGII